MSTTIKRVALVAVAALTLGVVSVAPSTAAINSDSLTLSAATAAQTTAETLTATSATVTLSFLGASTDSASVTAALVSGPAGNTALPYLVLAETASATIDGTNAAAGTQVAPNTAVVVRAGDAAKVTSAKFSVFLGVAGTSPVTAPTKAGTYVVKLTPATVGGSGALLGSTAQTLTITVTAAPALDTVAASATIILNKGETNSAAADDVVTFDKTLPVTNTTAAATIKVSLKNAAAAAVTAESYTATISGPGLLGSGAQSTTDAHNITAAGRALLVKNGDVVRVFPDGTSGVATVTISSAAGVILGTKSLTFYGAAASITAATTALTTGTVAKVGPNAGLVSFSVKDAAGTAVTTGTYYLVSADATLISNAYTACNAWNSTDGFTCDVTGVAKGTTTVYVTNRASATATTPTTEVKSGTVSIRVGTTTPASVSVTTDKSSYAPGEKATITVTVKDADGNVVPSGTYTSIFKTGGIVANYTLGGGSDTTTASSVDGAVDGVKTFTVYMPVTEGDVKFSWTTGSVAAAAGTGLATANQAVAGSVTVAVSSAATSAAIDAANEAAQAASDATDAALAAADAADAATTKAQEAVDAVATLSAQVSKLITALKAQITTLTNLVIKIQKKVRA